MISAKLRIITGKIKALTITRPLNQDQDLQTEQDSTKDQVSDLNQDPTQWQTHTKQMPQTYIQDKVHVSNVEEHTGLDIVPMPLKKKKTDYSDSMAFKKDNKGTTTETDPTETEITTDQIQDLP